MAKKNSNKILLIVLLSLLVVFAIFKISNISGKEKNFKSEFGEIDTNDIAQILLYPATENGEEIKFFKENKLWKAEKSGKIYDLRENAVENLITEIKNFKPTRLAAKTKDKWADYQVNDSLGTRLIVKNSKGDDMLDMMIGKFGIKQKQNQYQYQQNGNMNIDGTTYVREYSEDETYSVEGFVSFTFNQKFNTFRENSLFKLKKDDITKLQFEYQDSSYIAMKQDSLWVLDDKIGVETIFNTYLSQISNKTAQNFDDDYTPVGNPVYSLKISGNNMADTKLSAYQKDSANYIVNSTYNPDAYFIVDKSFIDAVFKPINYFTEE